MNTLLIVAGGQGQRLGAAIPKQYLMVKGKPVMAWTLQNVQSVDGIDRIVVVTADGWQDYVKKIFEEYAITKGYDVVLGGASRMESTLNGLKAISKYAQEKDKVCLLDANRPLVSHDSILGVINAAEDGYTASALEPSFDTLLVVNEHGEVCDSADRDRIWKAQTPEAAQFGLLYHLYSSAVKDGIKDKPMPILAMHYGYKVHAVQGYPRNFKITTAADLELFEAYLTLYAEKGML